MVIILVIKYRDNKDYKIQRYLSLSHQTSAGNQKNVILLCAVWKQEKKIAVPVTVYT